ncbi:matrix metalloproteinase-9-like [Lepeophtheirus salmonis]|uniref:matrix metalloproteinase-9-like n=1 Tax=Lepeophtheirus salmonis TaxID=72036 RepID=UPI001AE7BEC1|nr:matrix metalloproteinase-9-like isoform X2 [Lepeophtheirus salmonis]
MASLKVFSIFLTITTLLSQSNGQDCLTKNNATCVFPFIYGERIYAGCTTADNGGIFWCATSLYDTSLAKDYGNCAGSCRDELSIPYDGCRTVSGRSCHFPFIYKNIEYHNCTLAGDTRAWCAIDTYTNTNEAKFWGYCYSTCNVTPK